MKIGILVASIVWIAAPLAAQAPALQTHSSDIGFTYTLPADWQVVDTHPAQQQAQEQAGKDATSAAAKKGIECVQVALTAHHGTPASVIVAEALPDDCLGQTLTQKDLSGFASGAAEGLKQTFDMENPEYGSYTIGTHTMWVERVKSMPRKNPGATYIIEVVCSILKKGGVCFMAMEGSEAGMRVFENSLVALEGEPPSMLIPAYAFVKKPQ
jgi:hypothetical protein